MPFDFKKTAMIGAGLAAAFTLQACEPAKTDEQAYVADPASDFCDLGTVMCRAMEATAVSDKFNEQYVGLAPSDNCLIDAATKAATSREEEYAEKLGSSGLYQRNGFKGVEQMRKEFFAEIYDETVKKIPSCLKENPAGYKGTLSTPEGVRVIHKEVVRHHFDVSP